MNVLVVGASRGSGAAAVRALVQAGHLVTAFARSAAGRGPRDAVRHVVGDVLDDDALAKAMVGQDAVVVSLGISDPVAFGLLRRARRSTCAPGRPRSSTPCAPPARRLVVQSTYGIGETYGKLPLSSSSSSAW